MIPSSFLSSLYDEWVQEDLPHIQEMIKRHYHRIGNSIDILEGKYANNRGVTPYEVVYQKNRFRVLQYQSTAPQRFTTPIVLVYALIGAHYIFDLTEEKSFVRYLLDRGFSVYLVDWGRPSKVEGKNTIGDYIHKYLERGINRVRSISGSEKINLFGYCLGSMMSLIYTAVNQDKVKNLLLLTPPVDFENDDGVLTHMTQPEYLDVDRVCDHFEHLIPSNFIQTSFELKNKVGSLTSGLSLWQILWNKHALENYFAMNHWMNDNIPMASEFWKEYISKFYVQNQLMTNSYRMNGKVVDLKKITCPLLVIAAERDDIVTPKSARGAMEVTASTDKTMMMKRGGHVGVLIGSLAKNQVWPDIFSWLSNRSDRLVTRTGNITQY